MPIVVPFRLLLENANYKAQKSEDKKCSKQELKNTIEISFIFFIF